MSVLNVRIKHNIATYDLQLPVEATIRELSEKVGDLTGVPVSGQKLIFCGKQLSKDPSTPLAEVDFSTFLLFNCLTLGYKVMKSSP